MKHVNVSLIKAILLSSFLMFTGCVVQPVHVHSRDYGPPPHAPAHGYRHNYHGHELVYDLGLGVYVVVGLPSIYFYSGIYYRYDGDHWSYSHDLDKGWHKHKGDREIPPGLAKKKGKRKKGKRKDD